MSRCTTVRGGKPAGKAAKARDVTAMAYREIQAELKRRGLSAKGKKGVVTARLTAAMATDAASASAEGGAAAMDLTTGDGASGAAQPESAMDQSLVTGISNPAIAATTAGPDAGSRMDSQADSAGAGAGVHTGSDARTPHYSSALHTLMQTGLLPDVGPDAALTAHATDLLLAVVAPVMHALAAAAADLAQSPDPQAGLKAAVDTMLPVDIARFAWEDVAKLLGKPLGQQMPARVGAEHAADLLRVEGLPNVMDKVPAALVGPVCQLAEHLLYEALELALQHAGETLAFDIQAWEQWLGKHGAPGLGLGDTATRTLSTLLRTGQKLKASTPFRPRATKNAAAAANDDDGDDDDNDDDDEENDKIITAAHVFVGIRSDDCLAGALLPDGPMPTTPALPGGVLAALQGILWSDAGPGVAAIVDDILDTVPVRKMLVDGCDYLDEVSALGDVGVPSILDDTERANGCYAFSFQGEEEEQYRVRHAFLHIASAFPLASEAAQQRLSAKVCAVVATDDVDAGNASCMVNAGFVELADGDAAKRAVAVLLVESTGGGSGEEALTAALAGGDFLQARALLQSGAAPAGCLAGKWDDDFATALAEACGDWHEMYRDGVERCGALAEVLSVAGATCPAGDDSVVQQAFVTAVKVEGGRDIEPNFGTSDAELQRELLAVFTNQLGAKVNAEVLGAVCTSSHTVFTLAGLLESPTVEHEDVEEVLWAHLKDVLSSEGVGNVRTLAQWLVRAGRSIDELRDPAGMEPGYYGPIHRVLHEQCMDVKFARELVDVLVEAGANINATSYMHGPGPVLPTWAVESCRFYPEGLKLLCELPGVDVNQVGCHDDGNDVQMQCTALGLAAEKGDLDMCKYLLAKGAKVNTGSNNVSPLLLAAQRSIHARGDHPFRAEVITLLLKAGANIGEVKSSHYYDESNFFPRARPLIFGGP